MVDATPHEPKLSPTVPPEEITPELLPVVEELGLVENCRELAEEGFTIVENAAPPEFVARLRKTILDSLQSVGEGEEFLGRSREKAEVLLLAKDPVYAEAALNPKVMALAEFSVGRGFLLGSLISTIKARQSPGLPAHADQGMFPAPFPEHNMMLTACWACDDFTREGGATFVVPGSRRLLRHPTEEESATASGAIPLECRAGSIVMWDGRVWHGSCERTIEGHRAVLHASYYRLLMRPGENYSDFAGELIEKYGTKMSQLLGEEDFLYSKDHDYAKDNAKFVRTLNNAKS